MEVTNVGLNSFWILKIFDERIEKDTFLNILNQTAEYKYLVQIEMRAYFIEKLEELLN